MQRRYDLPVGLSDHSGSIYAGLAAATLGAEVLEVHVAFSHEMFGPDVPASLTTGELQQLVEGTRKIERMLDSGVDKDFAAEELRELRNIFTKSLVASVDIDAGTTLTAEHLKLKKPGTGLPASRMHDLIGRRVKQTVRADEMLFLHNIEF
jgi:N-acetylneuraminate synthase